MSSQTPVLTTVFLPSEPILNECYYIVILALPCTLCPVIYSYCSGLEDETYYIENNYN